jgi:ethanolamine-phosphate phospho-lyase
MVVERMKQERILVSTDGPYQNVLKIKPPLIFSRDNVDLFVSKLDQILASLV